MVKEDIIELSEKIVDIIYTPDQDELNQTFIKLMDLLLNFISNDGIAEGIELNQELLDMQSAFVKKDYGELADVLNYDLKEKIKNSI